MNRTSDNWLAWLAWLAALTLGPVCASDHDQGLLGLRSGFWGAPDFWEGKTDYRIFPQAKGVVRAIMLFARFPDAQVEESSKDLFERLVPEGQAFFKKASYGTMTLTVDVRHRWIPMQYPSTSGRYDCHQWATHKAYIAEVVGKADKDIDYRKYDIVYIVGSKNKGTPDSPTWCAHPGTGIKAGAAEVRHAVTFGNDVRNPDWGWQTLAHETGHVLGLPDLYSFARPARRYKDIHKHVGFWDLMGFQAPGCEYLAWQKYKLGWLSDRNIIVVQKGRTMALVTPIDEPGGVKAMVVPVQPEGGKEAYVVEVRSRDRPPKMRYGVLCYKVSLARGTGEGPIEVLPARPDDGDPELERRFVTLYHALYSQGPVLTDAAQSIKIEIEGREGRAYRISVTR